jgi:glycosyltransferase involved in cell wall biosynthesis
LARQDYDGEWEVVVVDNGSTDDSVDAVQAFEGRVPGLRVVSATRKGHSIARNAGAQAAKGDFLLYCDADDVASPHWVSAMASAAATCDVLGGYNDAETLNEGLNRTWRRQQRSDRLPTKMGFLPLALTANFGIRASVLDDIGGFNETYEEGCNDVEVSWRAQLAGYELCYVPDAVMAYRYRTDLSALGRQMYRRGLAEPKLYRDFRGRGVPKRQLTDTVRALAPVVTLLPECLLRRSRQGLWVKRVALLAGRVRGSIKYRTFYV